MQSLILYSHYHEVVFYRRKPFSKICYIVIKYFCYLINLTFFSKEIELYCNQVANKCITFVQFPLYKMLQMKYPVILPPMHSYPHSSIYNYWNIDNQIKNLFYFLNFKIAFKFKSTFCKTPFICQRWIINKELKKRNKKTNLMVPNCCSALVFVNIIQEEVWFM